MTTDSSSRAQRQRGNARTGVRAALLITAATLAVWMPLARGEDRKIEKRTTPVYPELARRMHVFGLVKVTATVAPDGTVVTAKATTGNRMLAPAAEDAVRRWKFSAAAEQSTIDISIDFQAVD